jgi:outer membrane protein
MKIVKNFFFIFFLLFSLLSNSYSDDKIKFIDLDSLIEKTIIGKKIIEDLNIINNNNLKLLKSKEDIIKKKQNEINTQKNIISSDELKIKIEDYQKQLSEFQNERQKLIANFNNQKQEKINDFFNQVTPTINEYMKEKDLSIIFDKKNIFIAKSDSNITQDIINLINDKFK